MWGNILVALLLYNPSLTALQGLIWRALLALCRRVRGGWGISFDRRYQFWYLTPLSLVVNLNTVTHFVSNSVTCHCVYKLFADASTIGSRFEPKCCLFVRFVHRHYILFPKTTMPFSWIIKKLVENNSVSFIFLKETGWIPLKVVFLCHLTSRYHIWVTGTYHNAMVAP